MKKRAWYVRAPETGLAETPRPPPREFERAHFKLEDEQHIAQAQM